HPLLFLCFIVGSVAGTGAGMAEAGGLEVVPFHTRDQGPFSQVIGLPPAEGGLLVLPGRLETRFVYDISNSDSLDKTPRETLHLDAETHRPSVSLRYGLAQGMEVGLDIPYVSHSKGVLDGFIDRFHQLTGLGPRKTNKYLIDMSYVRDGISKVDIKDSTSGIGDVLLTYGYQLYRTENPAPRGVAIRAGLKLPTGDEKSLTGSGGTDISLAVSATDASTLSRWHLTFYGMAGAIYMNNGKVLEGQHRRAAWFGSAGIGWNRLSWMAVKVQLDTHSPLYKNTDTQVLSSQVGQLVSGFTFALPRGIALDIALSENVFKETSPDETFHFALRKVF
ncbi:MAG TPA: DUF3187 family protein, partial [Anaerolineales bacterium]